jgi:hypothetical protein
MSPEFCSTKTASALATALFGDRGKLCRSLVIVLSADETPTVMGQFFLTEADGQAITATLKTESWQLTDTESWQLTDMEPAQD